MLPLPHLRTAIPAALCATALIVAFSGCSSVDTPQLVLPREAAPHASARYNPAWTLALQQAIPSFQRGGGYATSRTATLNLCEAAATWDQAARSPDIQPRRATPSYCSSACYLLLLKGLQNWDKTNPSPLISPEAWQHLIPRQDQHDGEHPWGWANANGPGLAVLIHELGAGYSFEDWRQAKPGDWMKIFWTDQIGRREHGHLTLLVKDGGDSVTFWSSNMPDGYGLKTISKDRIKHVLFTRITRPENFNNAPRIGYNAWLADLLKKTAGIRDVRRYSGIRQ